MGATRAGPSTPGSPLLLPSVPRVGSQIPRRDRSGLTVCDAQVHAPESMGPHPVPGIGYESLRSAMDAAGVDRAVIVPLGRDAGPSLEIARRSPDRFSVMPSMPMEGEHQTVALMKTLKRTPGIVGIRLSAFRQSTRSMLAESRLEWLFAAASRLELGVSINTMGSPRMLGTVAERHPRTRLILDHMGLEPFRTYDDLGPTMTEVVALAEHDNVAVKATCLPSAVEEDYPFPSLHEPLRRVIEAFGARRVFWGSDLTRLPPRCSYLQCKELFVQELPFLSVADREWIMGRGICEWLQWSL